MAWQGLPTRHGCEGGTFTQSAGGVPQQLCSVHCPLLQSQVQLPVPPPPAAVVVVLQSQAVVVVVGPLSVVVVVPLAVVVVAQLNCGKLSVLQKL